MTSKSSKNMSPLSHPEADLAWEAEVNAALAELSRAVINSVPLEDLSRLALAKAKEITRSEWGSVAFMDRQSRELVFPDLDGETSENSPHSRWNKDRWEWSPRWARCLADRQPLLINEPP